MRVPLLASLTLALFCCVVPMSAQPPGSPHETVSAVVDGAKVGITYGRPYMRGRKIIGGLVPYGRVWRTGADESTTLTTDAPLVIGGAAVVIGGASGESGDASGRERRDLIALSPREQRF